MTMNYNAVTPPRLKADSNMSISQFFTAFATITPAVYALENGGKPIVVRASYPDEFYVTGDRTAINPAPSFVDTITFDLVRREPGTLNDSPFQVRKDIKPRHRELHKVDGYKDADGESKEYIQVQAQWFDNLVEFACWTRSDTEAYALSEWLERHLVIYTGYYKEKGVQEMFYWGGGTQALSTSLRQGMTGWRNPLKVRGFTYFMRTESLWHVDYNEIKKILISLELEV